MRSSLSNTRRSTRFCFKERPVLRLVTIRPSVLCVMCSLVTFVIGLAIGTLLPANTASFLDQTRGLSGGIALDERSKNFVNHTLPDKLILYGGMNAIPDATVDWSSSVHQLDPAVTRLDNEEEGSSNHLPTVTQHASSYLNHPLPKSGSPLGSRTGISIENPQGKVQGLYQLVSSGIYWHPQVEHLLPTGFSDEEVDDWRNFTRSSMFLKMEQGCGRMQNRKLTFVNSSQACCRYRHNNDQIQGEIFSFYLSRILGIKNVPPSSLMVIKSNKKQWATVRTQLTTAQWSEEKPVVISKFIEDVKPAFIPPVFRTNERGLYPIKEHLVGKFTLNELKELVQWTDLIIFDYLTANLDRVVNNMFNEQWNPGMMNSPAHNLVKVASPSKHPDERTNEGLLLFIDNESGLLHGYRLLDKYDRYHKSLLQSVCLFRRSTARAIHKLSRFKNIGKLIRQYFAAKEPDIANNWLDYLPARNVKILNKRIRTVHQHIEKCKEKYRINSS